MKTCIIGPFLSSSGTTRHVRNLFRGLSEVNPGNVVLITFREMNESLTLDTDDEGPVYVFEKIPSPSNFGEFSDFIIKVVKQHKIDVLLPQVKPFILLCASLAKQKLIAQGKPIKIVGTWHSNFSWITQAPYHFAMASIGTVNCDGIIPVSNDVKDSINEYIKYPLAKITPVIPPGGIDYELISIPRNELLNQLRNKFSIDSKYVIFLGRLLYNKGVDTLIQAFKSISRDFKLVIIGKGPYEQELNQLIEELDLKSRVTFTDFVSDDEVYALLQGAELYCLPSRWESFSISTLEAMAAGCPVICSNVGGLGIWASKAAIMVNPNDISGLEKELKQVLSSETMMEDLGQKSKELAKLYDYKEIAKLTNEIARTIVGDQITDTENNLVTNFEFDHKSGRIINKDATMQDIYPRTMEITDFALFFPSEALENESKGEKSDLRYYLQEEI
jgi:glycosyltransferase involved in cell wall biosynthesis